jgi:hypothetical protein
MKRCEKVLYRTSIHEAGHAVIALAEYKTFSAIEVGEAGNVVACVTGISHRPEDDDQVRILVAGIMAARLERKSWRSPFLSTAASDISRVADFYRVARHRESLLRFNIDQTATDLRKNWTAVVSIARVFRKLRKVEFSHASELFEAARKAPKLEPKGDLSPNGWEPLIEDIQWRVDHPDLAELVTAGQGKA